MAKRKKQEDEEVFELKLHPTQRAFFECKKIYKSFVGGVGSGKALALDTPIPTPSGWTTMGQIKKGDVVFDHLGKQCMVTATTEIMYGRPCCRITFSDGTNVISDVNHEWPTTTYPERKNRTRSRANYSIRTTEEIQATLLCRGAANHAIQTCDPIQCHDTYLPVAPYTLGAWLGDGTSINAGITNADREIIAAIHDDGYETHLVPSGENGITNVFTICVPGLYKPLRDQNTGRFFVPPEHFLSRLRSIGVVGPRSEKKRIPAIYLRASEDQRKELLRGLMDTDGSANCSTGECEFTTTTKRLADTVLELCLSLGLKARITIGRAKLNGKDCGPKYRIHFTPQWDVFKVSRKLNRLHLTETCACRTKSRFIKKVETIDSVPVRCIQVDSPSNLYLCTRSFIATHNSFVGSCDILAHSEPGDLVVVAAPTFRQLSDSTMRVFKEVAYKFGLWDDDKYRKTDNQVMLKNGVEILFRSADAPEMNRGPSLRRVYLDEAGLMDEEMFNVMVGRLRQYGKQGFLSATFTPQGREHWSHRIFADPDNPNSEIFHCSTKDNPFVEEQFYQNLLNQYGRGEAGQLRAQQELEGLFVQIKGAEWGEAHFPKSVWFNNWPNDADAIKISTLDSSKGIGGKRGDYSAFVNLMIHDGLFWVEGDLDNTRNTAAIVDRMLEIQRDFQPIAFGLESQFGAEIMAESIERAIQNLPSSFRLAFNPVLIPQGNIKKEVRILRLSPLITGGFFRFKETPGTRILVNQLAAFPNGQHDDGCFIAGTMVDTVLGRIPIESIRPGDMVFTRNGLRKVTYSGYTGHCDTIRIAFSNGRTLTGTQNHPIWIGDKWKPLSKLRVNDQATSSETGEATVVGTSAGPAADVFNLQVDDQPEYFANGILVHNCDALEMAIQLAKEMGIFAEQYEESA